MVRISSSPQNSEANITSDVESFSSCAVRTDEFTPPPSASDKLQEQESAGTPTDVRDIHF